MRRPFGCCRMVRLGFRKNQAVNSKNQPLRPWVWSTCQPNNSVAPAGTTDKRQAFFDNRIPTARSAIPLQALYHAATTKNPPVELVLFLSTSWSFLSQGIMDRSRPPTSSIDALAFSTRRYRQGQFAWFLQHPFFVANCPLLESRRESSSFPALSAPSRHAGPRVMSPYFAVVLIE